ncbi:methyltransferase domain-containing protein [Microbacterium pygmaeum]|uniref:2-polyprenyl-3-methyl-5-hydroxy-6-metoxy-1,4-benzoquinol methylase n=1 Tax=Microbacterium pygmaeum TaxID=370764 RepID=A0A1G7V521_9MICO|nr:methyltransferase domain-containing protein [Microbacterium pygmaeum]SDG54853.1 2-polyprenyl-3-methyl-5-hydroxy-6-metoxy-1,4-benzoquinol methylase [Microbacterium pygmaeum]
MSLTVRDVDLRELMDDPDCDEQRLAATLRRFGTINRLISGWGGVYERRLRPHLARLGRPARVLDLGCGGGDVLARLAGLARSDGLDVEWVGVDPDPRALAVAGKRATSGVRFRCADSSILVDEGERFDAVISNHVLHHLDADELRSFTADSLALATGPVMHGDIERGRLAQTLYAVGITPFAPGTFLRTDGLRSIRRSYRRDELRAALGPEWAVEHPASFRLLAVGNGRG